MKKLLYILAFFTFLAPAAGQQGMLLVGNCGGSIEYTPFLDAYPGATVVYSTMLENSNYDGPAFGVRRESDKVTKDIYFCPTGYLDTADLKQFIGSANAQIVTWYDQSGNGYHAIANEDNIEPWIAQSGVIFRRNGRLSIEFSIDAATRDWLQYSGLAFSSGSISIFSAVQHDTPTELSTSIFDAAARSSFSSSTGFRFDNLAGNFRYGTNSAFTTYANSSTAIGLYSGIRSATARTIYINGSQVNTTSTSGSVDFTGVTQHKIGAVTSGTDQATAQNGLDGAIFFIAVYNTDETSNRAGIETNINSRFSIY